MREYLNTLENYFTHIYLVADEASKNDLCSFFSSGVDVRLAGILDVKKDDQAKENEYTLDDDLPDDSVVVFSDKFPAKRVVDRSGNEVFAWFDINKTSGHSGGDIDIYQYIVPVLKIHGIKTIICYGPDMAKIEMPAFAKYRMYSWKAIRRVSRSAFSNLRHIVRRTGYLKKDQKGLTNDESRGYSIMYGNGKYMNFEDGFRRTIRDESIESKGNVFVFGPCFVRGLAQQDSETMCSLIQKYIPDRKIWNYGSEFGVLNLIMRLPKYRAGDVVVLFSNRKRSEIERESCFDAFYDMTDTYRRLPRLWKHLFDDPNHYDNTVHYAVSEDLTKVIESVLNSCDNSREPAFCFGKSIKRAADIKKYSDDQDLLKWIEDIETVAPYLGGTRGAIVMNCNPFTNGHRYLIEKASKEVDELFIFVLEENKSQFSFEDRIMLVKKGTEDIANVNVFPGGKHIISAQTLPGYFNKKELSDTVVDLSCDLDFFVRIAETLHISVRFAGAEPLDPFTDRYNKKMAAYLPKYGVEFKEIERVQSDGKPVSASLVRELLSKKDFDHIKTIVPDSTYTFLIDNYT